jgi:site-specific recombinase XerD
VATLEQYTFVLRRKWLPWCEAEGITRPDQVTRETVERFTRHLEAGKLAVQSVRTYQRTVRVFLDWLVEEQRLVKFKIKAPKAPKRLLVTLTREEIDHMEAAAVDERDRLILRVLADTGVRLSELLGLRREDLYENTHDKLYNLRVMGKGNRERLVSIPPATYKRLKQYAETEGPKGAAVIFTGKRRRPESREFEPLTKSGVEQMIKKLGKEAGLTKEADPHRLRHSYATWQVNKGANLVMLMHQLGHQTLAMVSQVYAHPTGDDVGADMMRAFQAK